MNGRYNLPRFTDLGAIWRGHLISLYLIRQHPTSNYNLISKDSSQNITKPIKKIHVWHTLLYIHIYHEKINQIHAYRHFEITKFSFKSYQFSSLVLPFFGGSCGTRSYTMDILWKNAATGNHKTPNPAFSGLFRRSFCCWGVGLHGSATKCGKKSTGSRFRQLEVHINVCVYMKMYIYI